LNSVLGIFFKKLNGLQKYQHFVFEAARPDIVKAQLIANGAFTEFNLLKSRKASVSEIIKEIKSFSVLVLTPPPLDYKRQEYLNIRPFVRDEFKDITCPKPIYTDNE
ncbi:10217_t:CDS:1, partial [Ambispora leptoticha]